MAAQRGLKIAQRVAEAHGFGGRPIKKLRSTGIANDIWALGDDLVLRIGRDPELAWPDTRTESVAVPIARAAGVTTPALVVCDLSRAIVDAPVSIYERVPGDALGLVIDRRSDWSDAARALGRDLARLHAGVTEVDDPRGWLDEPEAEDARAALETCRRSGALGDDAEMVERWLDRLEPALVAVPPRFLHNDLHTCNVLVDADSGGYAALIDWGDAGWGDPAIELATCTTRLLAPLVAGYADAAPQLVDDGFCGRVLWNQLGVTLRRIANPRPPRRTPEQGRARLHRLAGYVADAGAPWRTWAPG